MSLDLASSDSVIDSSDHMSNYFWPCVYLPTLKLKKTSSDPLFNYIVQNPCLISLGALSDA